MGASQTAPCSGCGAPLAADQRYCLTCGERAGARGALLRALLGRLQTGAASDGATATAPPSRHPRLRLPAPRVSALLVLVFFGFGTLLGSAAGSGGAGALDAGRLKLVVPATPAPATTSSASTPAEAQPPPAEEQATPGGGEEASSQTAASTQTKTAPSSQEPASRSEGEGSSGASGSGSAGARAGAGKPRMPAIRHVFLIVLSDEPYAALFGPESKARYLAGTLESHGELLVRYDAVAHEQLANEIALISGQGPTAETAADCPTYAAIAPASTGAEEQVLGNGCVYPATTQTLPGQLAAKHLTWRAYVQSVEGPCRHPTLGQPDPSAAFPAPGPSPYATYRNPFVYFAAIAQSPACAADDVGLDRLKADLSSKRPPNFAYVAPDRCHDGSPVPCAPGAPGGPAQADGFLRTVVGEITASSAYKKGGLIVITGDEAPSSGELADSSSCCGQPRFPNLANAGPAGPAPRGGGSVGALLLSPYIKKAGTSQETYNHFSLLATIEDLFGLGRIGYARLPSVKPLEPALLGG